MTNEGSANNIGEIVTEPWEEKDTGFSLREDSPDEQKYDSEEKTRELHLIFSAIYRRSSTPDA